MSGGEQQMLAIGRALMQEPRFLILDEPSLGLAPVLVQEIFGIIKSLRDRGLTTLLVEQNVSQTLQMVDYAYVIENGRIIMEGKGQALADNPKVKEAYLGF
jgi:branched-chain amino acid transport system ATP-binding protein